MNRREFFGRAAGGLAAVSSIASAAKARPTAVSDTINVGVIGPGARGQDVMRSFLRVPGVHFSALCDIYEPRFDQARKVTGEETPAVRDYRALLDRKDVDVVLVATPLGLHEEHVAAVLESGRPVYSEKDMALTLEGCDRLYAAVKRTKLLYQFGTQYHYAPWFQEAVTRIKAGKIGQVTQIYSYWHRNNDWRRPVPNPADAKLEHLINWRMYRDMSGGILAEFGTHMIQWSNEIFGAMPVSVAGSGGIDYWKDGRELPDNVQVAYRYPDGQTHFFCASLTNSYNGMHFVICGTGGTIVLTQIGGTQYLEPAPPVRGEIPLPPGVVAGANYRPEIPYAGPGEAFRVPEGLEANLEFLAARSFFDCLRNDKRPEVDEATGWTTGITVTLGNEAIEKKMFVEFGTRAHLPA
ncbi:MAG: Gfo/Idh/MocA family oxidoreductase [Candidatus Acidiferrales bacterium]